MKYVTAKSILSPLSEMDSYFGIRYNMNIYRGCQHGCIYCDSRSKCYRIENFDEIEIKENALQLLENELRKKKAKATIGTGSMNDPYMPLEKDLGILRKALEILAKYRWPVHIITKGTGVIWDIDLIKKIGEVYSAVSLTITTANDRLSKIIEPGAPPSSHRFAALKKLSSSDIYTGVSYMPVLPHINDSYEEIEAMVRYSHENGAKYLIAWLGMTIREGQREFFYQNLDKHFSGLSETYRKMYGNQYSIAIPDAERKYNHLTRMCANYRLPLKMQFYKPPQIEQLKLF